MAPHQLQLLVNPYISLFFQPFSSSAAASESFSFSYSHHKGAISHHKAFSSQSLHSFNKKMRSSDSTTIDVPESKKDVPESSAIAKGKAPLVAVVAKQRGGWKRGVAIFDFLLRIGAITAALAAASIMGTSQETLPFFTQFFQFQASYDDLPTFQFFVIAMAIVGGYLVLSLPFSIVSIVRPQAVGPRILLLIFDTVALTLSTAAAAAAAAIVYLAHNGDSNTNWLAICQQFGDFCQQVSGAVVAAFVSVVVFVFLIFLSALSIRKP